MFENNTRILNGRTIRCILFDCGNTLWTVGDDTTWKKLTKSANLRATTLMRQYITLQSFSSQDEEKLGHKFRQTLDEITHQFRLEHPYNEPNFAHATVEAITSLGFPQLSNEIGAEIFEALRIRSGPQSRILFPDALSMLATLQERGFILGIVTNRAWGGPLFVEDMRNLGLLNYFDPACMAVSADLSIRKPNPAIFMYALDALQVAPTEAVMVGDSLRADIAGANPLGILTVWMPYQHLIAEVKATLSSDEPDLTTKDLLSYEQRKSEQQNRPLSASAQPDLIIEHLSELLNIFLKAGVQ